MKIKTSRDLREALGMNQTEFAEALGTRQGHISSWETGAHKPGMMMIAKMIKLAQKRLGKKLTFYDFIGDVNDGEE